MRIYLMTDLEAVAGIIDSENWCRQNSRYYDLAKELLTEEVNAAVDGFFSAGATYVLVADGHGHGAMNPALLDTRAELLRGWATRYPLGLEEGFDACAWVGQHAKSRTEFAHLAHTGSFSVLDFSINGISMGEFGQVACCASQLGIPSVFAAGGLAFTKEAEALVPGIETVWVVRGNKPGRGDECSAAEYALRNLGGIHRAPGRARELIRNGAARALQRFQEKPFGRIDLVPPFEKTLLLRHTEDSPKTFYQASHPSDVAELMNLSGARQTVETEEQLKELLGADPEPRSQA